MESGEIIMSEIDICEFCGEGYMPVIASDGWRVAVVNSCDKLLEKNLEKAEKHFETEEVFALIKGNATLFIGEDRKRYDLKIGKMYNVKRGIWHSLAMGSDSSLIVIENDNTSEKNTEYKFFNMEVQK